MGIVAIQGLNGVGTSHLAITGLLLHLVGYGVTNLGVFMAVIAFSPPGEEDISGYAGLANRSPLLAGVITIGLFSLAGMPFFAGFVTKFYLFSAVASQGYLWLTGLAILNSLISLYYYLVVVRTMYIDAPLTHTPLRLSNLTVTVLSVLVLGIIAIGLYPEPLIEIIEEATRAIIA